MRFNCLLLIAVILTLLVFPEATGQNRDRQSRNNRKERNGSTTQPSNNSGGHGGRPNNHGPGNRRRGPRPDNDVFAVLERRRGEPILPDGAVLIEGDILITEEERGQQVQALIDRAAKTNTGTQQNNTGTQQNNEREGESKRKNNRRVMRSVTYVDGRNEWPKDGDGKVHIPYDDSAFSSSQRAVFDDAIDQFNVVTCIKFEPRSNAQDYYIKFINGDGCWSWLGKISLSANFQELSLEANENTTCVTEGIVVHELGHALGHHHEQNRPDRDNFITVLTTSDQFVKQHPDFVDLHNTPYDFRSVLHYSGVGSRFVMLQQSELADKVGRTGILSFYDMQAINSRYSCSENCPTQDCPADSFQGADCNCYCFSGDTFDPLVICGEVPNECTVVNIDCDCGGLSDCSALPSTVCNIGNGKCECVDDTYEFGGNCIDLEDVMCASLHANCLCSHKESSACNSAVEGSSCDDDTNECICFGLFLELEIGSCTDANTLPCTLGQNCHCNSQTDSPCSSIDNSDCSTGTGACECVSGYVQLLGLTTCTDESTLTCGALDEDCACGTIGSGACDAFSNAECDEDSGACICSEGYRNNGGECELSPDCLSLNEDCSCSTQGDDACSAISNSVCDGSSDQCICRPNYEVASSTSCSPRSNPLHNNGRTLYPFTNQGTNNWEPVHVRDDDSPIRRDRSGNGWYLLANSLSDGGTLSTFTLVSPQLQGKWCLSFFMAHSHSQLKISGEYVLTGATIPYATLTNPSSRGRWFRKRAIINLPEDPFQFKIEATRYNSGDFWAALDRIYLGRCRRLS